MKTQFLRLPFDVNTVDASIRNDFFNDLDKTGSHERLEMCGRSLSVEWKGKSPVKKIREVIKKYKTI